MKFALEVELPWKCRGYDTAALGDPLRAFFVRLRPGERIHRHRDADDVDTLHLVVQTNEQARNFWIDPELGEQSMHMEQGKVYRVDRSLEHWAENAGPTDRVHLLLEFARGL